MSVAAMAHMHRMTAVRRGAVAVRPLRTGEYGAHRPCALWTHGGLPAVSVVHIGYRGLECEAGEGADQDAGRESAQQ